MSAKDIATKDSSLSPIRTQVPAVYSLESIRRNLHPAGVENGLSPASAVRAALRWWKLAVPATLLLLAVSLALIWYFFQPVYRATAWIKIEDTQPYIAYQSKEESLRFVQTQVELIRGPLVLGPVVGQPEVAQLPELREENDPIQWLTEKINVSSVGESELYRVTYEGPDPKGSALLVNAVVDGYFNLREQDEAARTQRVIELLDQEQDRRGREVNDLRHRVRELSREIYGNDPIAASSSTVTVVANHPLEALRQRLITAEVDRQTMEARIKAFEESMEHDPDVPEIYVEMAVDESSDTQELQALLMSKRSLLERTAAVALNGQENPAYRRLKREVESLEQALLRARIQSRPRIKERMQAMAAMERRNELAQMRATLESYRAIEDRLNQQYETEVESLTESGDRSLELEFARAELAREEAVHEQIAQRALALHTEMRAPARVTLMKRATPPSIPVEEIPWKNIALASLMSLCVPFGIAMLWERNVRRISDSEQLGAQSTFPMVAEIARLPMQRGGWRAMSGRENLSANLFEESVDALRTSLTLAEARQNLQVLVVASSIPGEGKTSVASQLAVSIARSTGELTLLIDADMRSPDVHRIFNIPNEPGLSKVLDNTCSVDDAIVRDWSDNVHLLPAGRLHKSPHKLVGGNRLQELLEELRPFYRHIIIDTPPILAASEALVLAKHGDGTVVCAMRDHSRLHQVRMACERLVAAGATPVGAVLNAVPTSRYASTYGDYSYRRG